MRLHFLGGFLALGLLAGAQSGQAVVYAELGDAGDLPAGAQTVLNGTTQITGGAVGPGGFDVDLYQFSWGGGALTIDTIGSSFNTILYLFFKGGHGIAGNDDALGFTSQLRAGFKTLVRRGWCDS